MSLKYIIGIDEVGRGPLAGPVTVCACMVASDFDMSWFEGIRDSKKLSEKKRNEWFNKAESARKDKKMQWVIVSKTAPEIDARGIAVVIREAVGECLSGLKTDSSEMHVFLDGSLHAPQDFKYQETIIKGDEKVPVIGMASILAKVTRDKHMDDMGKKYSGYGFENHKGYGTEAHYAAIHKGGVLPLHRKSFLKGIKAFTLIELLVVISIISLLSSIVMASLNTAREKARIGAAQHFSALTYHAIGAYSPGGWSFEEGAGGNAADSSGMGNTGSVVGATWSTDTYSSSASRYSLQFASGNYVSVPNALGIGTANFTITSWIKTTSASGQMYIIGNAGSGDGFRFGISGGVIGFLIGNGGFVESTCGSTVVNDNKWHHIAGVFDRTGLLFSCYVDGKAAGTVALSSAFAGMNDSAPRIGAPVCCVPFVGYLDDVRVFTTNLSGAMIRKDYATTRGLHVAFNKGVPKSSKNPNFLPFLRSLL